MDASFYIQVRIYISFQETATIMHKIFGILGKIPEILKPQVIFFFNYVVTILLFKYYNVPIPPLKMFRSLSSDLIGSPIIMKYLRNGAYL